MDGYIICIKLCMSDESFPQGLFSPSKSNYCYQLALRALIMCIFKLANQCFIAAELHAHPFSASLLSFSFLLRIPQYSQLFFA